MLDLIATRRDLHQIPEIGLEEFETHAYLMAKIAELTAGKSFVTIKTWQTGIVVKLTGTAPEKTIGWRTDIDGLPIIEDTGLDFKSRHEGRMHACGHDPRAAPRDRAWKRTYPDTIPSDAGGPTMPCARCPAWPQALPR